MRQLMELIGASLAAAAALPASAAITDIHLEGPAVVAYAVADPEQNIFPPSVGTQFQMIVDLHLGTADGDPDLDYPAAPPDGFTGHYSVSQDMLYDRYSVFNWLATTLDDAFAYGGGEFEFVSGKLVNFSLYSVGDPDGHSLSTTSFSEDLGYYSESRWGGTWLPTVNSTDTIPEPATWGLMIGGFAMTGVAMRRRKVAIAA